MKNISDLYTFRSLYINRLMAVMLLLGFSSGLPLPLTSGTLQAWITVAGLDLTTIGMFSLVGLPYALKFLWAPVIDRFTPPWSGRRRGWILPIQVLLLVCTGVMAFVGPKETPLLFATLAFLLSFVSASQDIAIDAYRTDVLPEEKRGAGVAVFVLGYRIAMLLAGAMALILSDHIGWEATYLIMACLVIIGIIGASLGKEKKGEVSPPRTIQEAVVGPLKDYLSRRSAVTILLFIILYKLGDAYAGSLTTTFLLRGVGFTPTDVGVVNKGMGLIATIVGALYGGTLMVRLGLYRSLMIFGFLQMVSNLSFMVLALLGNNYPMMVFAVAFENLCGGMGTAAFVSLLMVLCNPRYSATQFALLSSLASLGRVLIAPTSGYIVTFIGWAPFFFLTTVTALPGLLLLFVIREKIRQLKRA